MPGTEPDGSDEMDQEPLFQDAPTAEDLWRVQYPVIGGFYGVGFNMLASMPVDPAHDAREVIS